MMIAAAHATGCGLFDGNLILQGSEERVIVKFNIKKAIAIAASLFLIVAFGFVIVNYVQNLPKSNNAILIKEIIKENPVGRKTTFRLADGSEIKMDFTAKFHSISPFLAVITGHIFTAPTSVSTGVTPPAFLIIVR